MLTWVIKSSCNQLVDGSQQTELFSDGTMPATNGDKIYELKAHSWFKEVGRDTAAGTAGSAGVAIPRRKIF